MKKIHTSILLTSIIILSYIFIHIFFITLFMKVSFTILISLIFILLYMRKNDKKNKTKYFNRFINSITSIYFIFIMYIFIDTINSIGWWFLSKWFTYNIITHPSSSIITLSESWNIYLYFLRWIINTVLLYSVLKVTQFSIIKFLLKIKK